MKKAFTIHLISYEKTLKDMGIRFKAEEKTLTVGTMKPSGRWAIFISCKTLETSLLLTIILPVLRKSGASYRIIKDQVNQYRLNSGAFGDNEVGKTISIFPNNENQAIELATVIAETTRNFKGPAVIDSTRIGEIVYIQEIKYQENGHSLSCPAEKDFPFNVPSVYKIRARKKRLIGKYYLPVQLIRSSPKGDIFKAINIKGFAFNWCLIKEGKPVALDDHFDRTMTDRLLWQKEVLKSISKDVFTPDIIDFCQSNDASYLITAFADGRTLGDAIREVHARRTWVNLSDDDKRQLLNWFLQSVDIVYSIHGSGFVHRDITDSNFMVLKDKRLCIIDFELSYHIKSGRPDPPFLLGTYGYAAPEQLQYAVPDFAEDVYSLGALLFFTLTAMSPCEITSLNLQIVTQKLNRLTMDRSFSLLVSKCLSSKREQRPILLELRLAIQEKLKEIN